MDGLIFGLLMERRMGWAAAMGRDNVGLWTYTGNITQISGTRALVNCWVLLGGGEAELMGIGNVEIYYLFWRM